MSAPMLPLPRALWWPWRSIAARFFGHPNGQRPASDVERAERLHQGVAAMRAALSAGMPLYEIEARLDTLELQSS